MKNTFLCVVCIGLFVGAAFALPGLPDGLTVLVVSV